MKIKDVLQDWYWKNNTDTDAIKIVNGKIIHAVISFNENNGVYDVRIYNSDDTTLLQHYCLSGLGYFI